VRTVHLSDEGHAGLAALLEEAGQRMATAGEQDKLEQLTAVAFELYGLSSWRSNGARAFPAGSVFTSKGASECTTNTN
jgi:hypothetical protein